MDKVSKLLVKKKWDYWVNLKSNQLKVGLKSRLYNYRFPSQRHIRQVLTHIILSLKSFKVHL